MISMSCGLRKKQCKKVIRQAIYEFLWSDETGLPASYTLDEIEERGHQVFAYVYQQLRVESATHSVWASRSWIA